MNETAWTGEITRDHTGIFQVKNWSRNRQAGATLFATYICVEVAIVIPVVSGPTFQRVLGLSDTQLGAALGALSLGSLVICFLVGRLNARFGSFRLFTASLAGLMLTLGLVPAAGGFAPLFAALALTGLAMGGVHNTGLTLLADIFPRDTRRVMALAAALWFSSSIVSTPLIGAWLSLARARGLERWSYGLPLLASVAVLAACLALVAARLAWTEKFHHPRGPEKAPAAPPERGWGWILPLAFCHGVMIYSFTGWTNPMIQAVFGADDFRGSLGYAVFALGLAAGRFLLTSARLAVNDRALLGASGLSGGFLLALALHAPGYPATLAMICLGAFAGSATAPCIFSLVAARFPRTKARIYGFQGAGISLGCMAGPFLVGVLLDRGIPFRLAMLVSPAAAVTLGAVAIAWLKTDKI